MPTFVPLSTQTHKDYHWRPYTSYGFTAKDPFAPIAVNEISRAALAAPTAFLLKNEMTALVMLQGYTENLMVTPDGKWLGGYTPAIYRSHPFVSMKDKAGKPLVCFDQEVGLVTPEPVEGSQPFMEDGEPSAKFKETLAFLHNLDKSRELTKEICDLIRAQDLLVPWEFTLTVVGEQKPVTGLYTVDETKLKALDDATLRTFMDKGILGVIYAHLLSKGQVSVLGRLAQLHERMKPAEPNPELVSELFDDKDDTLKFNF